MCQMFDLETLLQNGTYHMVAVEPIIGNVDVLHHMVLFGCEGKWSSHVTSLSDFHVEDFEDDYDGVCDRVR